MDLCQFKQTKSSAGFTVISPALLEHWALSPYCRRTTLFAWGNWARSWQGKAMRCAFGGGSTVHGRLHIMCNTLRISVIESCDGQYCGGSASSLVDPGKSASVHRSPRLACLVTVLTGFRCGLRTLKNRQNLGGGSMPRKWGRRRGRRGSQIPSPQEGDLLLCQSRDSRILLSA